MFLQRRLFEPSFRKKKKILCIDKAMLAIGMFTWFFLVLCILGTLGTPSPPPHLPRYFILFMNHV